MLASLINFGILFLLILLFKNQPPTLVTNGLIKIFNNNLPNQFLYRNFWLPLTVTSYFSPVFLFTNILIKNNI